MIHAVAINYKGTTYTLPRPARHYMLVDLIIREHREYSFDIGVKGFLTDEGVFLNRAQAGQHALACGQVSKLGMGGDLYSEEVW